MHDTCTTALALKMLIMNKNCTLALWFTLLAYMNFNMNYLWIT